MEIKNMTYEIEQRLSKTVKKLNDILVDFQLAEYEQEQSEKKITNNIILKNKVNVLYWLNEIREALREAQLDFNAFQDNSPDKKEREL